ncbi:ribosome hibernation-promoting factor, HPF/YfiA family [Asticcacaulis biprosthecium]|uniref:ribosome hibernation-promoting factor, HPF/YfiA family n=1 Tax=Asticcacaulis biprosthecium TaxID=76891 RepID=UPI0002E47F8D|nr:ribosome-associated translation inhibitor RaiA [Asticcacaulis biprosthecium]
MHIQVSGKQCEVGDALRQRIETELAQGIEKFFDRGGAADVTLSKQGHMFRADCVVRLASGQTLVSHAFGGDAHSAFNGTLDNIEKRVRRYKGKLKQHHFGTPQKEETANVTVLRSADLHGEDIDGAEIDDGMDHASPPHSMIIAETEAPLRTMTVSAAVEEMELSNYPAMMFRNAAHGGLSMIYRRPDGNIGWVDPERTSLRKAS